MELVHHHTGERVTVIASSASELLLEDAWPAGHVVAPHRHPALAERWTVLEGRAAITIGGAAHLLDPGDSVSAPPGVQHAGRNLAPGPTVLRISFRPPGRWLEAVESLFRGDDVREVLRRYPAELAP